MIVGIIVGIVAVAVIVGFVFVNQPSFGRAPQGERLERIKKSPHYKDGEFRNLHSTMMMTSQKGRLGAFWGFLFKQETDLRPEKAYTGRPRILWGFSGFVCKQAVQGGGCLQACRYAGD